MNNNASYYYFWTENNASYLCEFYFEMENM